MSNVNNQQQATDYSNYTPKVVQNSADNIENDVIKKIPESEEKEELAITDERRAIVNNNDAVKITSSAKSCY